MKKEIKIILFVLIGLFSIGLNYVLASANEGWNDGQYNPFSMYIYTVNEIGSTKPKDTFSLNETPYLYMHLPEEGYSVAVTFWLSPSNNISYESTGLLTEQDIWITPSNWENHKEIGKWQINAGALYSLGTGYTASTSFNVTPEPLAMILFLIGGAPVAMGILKRKRFSI